MGRKKAWEWLTDRDLDDAWAHVRQGSPAPGVDGLDLASFEADLAAQIKALLADLLQGAYRPQALLGVDLPKKSGGFRRVVIATVRDRVAQTAALQALQPFVEEILHPSAFAYRQNIGVQDALLRVCALRDRGLGHALRADIRSFFDSVPHGRLFEMLDTTLPESPWLGLLREWLTATVIEPGGRGAAPVRAGLPQGLTVSPMLANFYLTPFDREMDDRGWKLVRYADDMAVCCADAPAAARARDEAAAALAALGLALAEEKTELCAFDKGFLFLGAKFIGAELIPAAPHPYEETFTPPPPPKRKRPQALPGVMLRTLYIENQGCRVSRHAGRVVVSRDDKVVLDLPALHVDQIFVFGRAHLTTPFMTFCLERDIPVVFFSSYGRYYGMLRAVGAGNYHLVRAQFALLDDPARRLETARRIVAGKIANCRALLAQHARNHPARDLEKAVQALKAAEKRAANTKDLESLRGVEGTAAAAHFAGLSLCLPEGLRFARRTRRPPTDPVNSLLSFGYSLVFYLVHSCLCARGLDPHIGLLHEPGRDHPALASDLVEEFRAPIVDALVLSLLNRGEMGPADFHYDQGTPAACLLRDESRPVYLRAFEEKMETQRVHPDAGYAVDWRRVIDLQVSRMRRFIEGKIDRYQPFQSE